MRCSIIYLAHVTLVILILYVYYESLILAENQRLNSGKLETHGGHLELKHIELAKLIIRCKKDIYQVNMRTAECREYFKNYQEKFVKQFDACTLVQMKLDNYLNSNLAFSAVLSEKMQKIKQLENDTCISKFLQKTSQYPEQTKRSFTHRQETTETRELTDEYDYPDVLKNADQLDLNFIPLDLKIKTSNRKSLKEEHTP